MRPLVTTAFCRAVCVLVSGLIGCAVDPPRSTPQVIHARFDPVAGEVPMPTDFLRDDLTGRLDLPDDDKDLNPAEAELYRYLNTLEGWPKSSTATVRFSGSVADWSVTSDTVKVFSFTDGKLTPFSKATLELDEKGTKLKVTPPDEGWPRGAAMAVVVRGGENGVRGARDETVECDAAFYYLRVRHPLNTHPDFRAFPGATREEREQAARDLEELRVELQPYFVALESNGVPRPDVAALWTFTINDHTEVLMDKESGKMPLPIDLLIDHKTGKVDLPERDEDSERDKEIKRDLRAFDGFATTASQLFEFSREVDPKTVTSSTVELYRVKDGEKIVTKVELAQDKGDGFRVELIPQEVPLDPRTTYAVVLRPGIRDSKGEPVQPMLIGHFLKARHPLLVNGKKQLESLDDESVETLEWARKRVSPLLDKLGRDAVLAAWPFTTMSVVEPLIQAAQVAETLALPTEPIELFEKTAAKAAAEFPIGALSILRVKKVFNGKIATADYLDPKTRRPYPDGSHKVRWVPFTMTIPKDAKADEPLPVVIFGHAICTERRFVLAVADGLAKKGFAAISIDLPYHGTRTHCAWNGPICFPDPLSKDGKMLCPDPCPSGSTCHPDGKCRDKNGGVTELTQWPVIPMKQASGAAFIELSSIAGTMAHFRQAVIDLSALSRVLRKASWASHIGYKLKTDSILYLGQSLGGILGGTYVALDPSIGKAVLNVPGANLVPMFQKSPYFKSHIDSFLVREKIEKGTSEYQRFLVIAKWFMDAVDPINVARYLISNPLPGQPRNDRQVMVQMATLDFIIPNDSTKHLTTVSGVPRLDYIAEHAFLVIPVEPAYPAGTRDAADFLAGSLKP